MKKPLANFRYETRQFIAKLKGMKSIMRAETRRTITWWLVLPAIGDSDAVCVLIRKMNTRISNHHEIRVHGDYLATKEYADRIVAA